MKSNPMKRKEPLSSVIETKVDETVVKGRKAVRDAKRGLQEVSDKVKDNLDETGLKIKKAKKKIF